MLEELKEKVYKANLELVKQNLVIYTWGNVSEITEDRKYVVIKPSGVNYDSMKPKDMVILDLEGNVVEGELRPSSDAPTHLEIYKKFDKIGGIVHTHSIWATEWAQACRSIPAYGTTHADYFYGDIPCTRKLTKEEIEEAYEKNTGKIIIETFENIDVEAVPAVLCAGHGPFAWGKDSNEAVYHAVVLEKCAEMAYFTEKISENKARISQDLLDKHYLRKHGKDAYYGQKNNNIKRGI